MRKYILTLAFSLSCLFLYGQTNDSSTLKFLGIPVDGSEAAMVSALKNKGFKYNSEFGNLSGKFNGKESNIYISENNGKVDRVVVADANTSDETSIMIAYNNLLSQFKKNDKYVELTQNNPIPEGEDISYEMLVHNKRYEASFYLKPEWTDAELETISAKSSEMNEEERLNYALTQLENKLSGVVWFSIFEHYGKYYISIFYDNLRNRPNGEDL